MTLPNDPFREFGRALAAAPWAEDDAAEVEDIPLPEPYTVTPPNGVRASNLPPQFIKQTWRSGQSSGTIRIDLRVTARGVSLSWNVRPAAALNFWVKFTPADEASRPSWFLLGEPAGDGGNKLFEVSAQRLGIDPVTQAFDVNAFAD